MTHVTDHRPLNALGEAGIIQLIQQRAATQLPSYVLKGMGDDCAVLETEAEKDLLVTTDTLIEGVHFTNQTLSPEALGWKALAVNVSDIGAMGGAPRTAFLAIGLKPETQVSFLESFMAGFNDFAAKTGVILAGGDTVESPSLTVVTVTLLGDCGKGRAVCRSGAEVGDDIWVTGHLGDGAGGLFLIQNKSSPAPPQYESLILAHQKPVPPFELARALGEGGLAHAMIDLSDGIAKDLGHICEQSGVGALLQAASFPLSDPLVELGKEVMKDPLHWALQGGEDYQLCFAASPTDAERILDLSNRLSVRAATKIGAIVGDPGLWLETAEGRRRLESRGFLHFSR